MLRPLTTRPYCGSLSHKDTNRGARGRWGPACPHSAKVLQAVLMGSTAQMGSTALYSLSPVGAVLLNVVAALPAVLLPGCCLVICAHVDPPEDIQDTDPNSPQGKNSTSLRHSSLPRKQWTRTRATRCPFSKQWVSLQGLLTGTPVPLCDRKCVVCVSVSNPYDNRP